MSIRTENKCINIITGFDGASPFSKDGIITHKNNFCEIRPSWRKENGISEEALGAGSSFSVKIENTSDKDIPLRYFINWQDKNKVRLKYHDYVMVLFPDKKDWEILPCVLDCPGAWLELAIPPGITHIGSSPWYGYQKAVEYLKSKNRFPEVRYFAIGESEEGREIPALVVDDSNYSGKKDVIIMARNHAYESAGSFCTEGMIDMLLENVESFYLYKRKYRFHFLAMTNPDGVANGLSRLTAPRGADLNRCVEQNDSAWRALKNYIDNIRPGYLLNIHNWMDKEKDGILSNTKRMALEFRRQMPDLIEDGHYWEMEWTDLYLKNNHLSECPPESESWKDYVRKKYRSTALTLELPWYNRTTARMRQIGQQSLIAFLNSGEDFK